MELKTVKIDKPADMNFILGQSHFIKTIEDLYEAIVQTAPGMKFGIAFCESSGPALVRYTGNEANLIRLAQDNALALACGHAFIIFMEKGYPINILNAVKNVPEVCRILCATANPVEVIVAETEQGCGILAERLVQHWVHHVLFRRVVRRKKGGQCPSGAQIFRGVTRIERGAHLGEQPAHLLVFEAHRSGRSAAAHAGALVERRKKQLLLGGDVALHLGDESARFALEPRPVRRLRHPLGARVRRVAFPMVPDHVVADEWHDSSFPISGALRA